MEKIIYDLSIVGGGPAGCAASIYAARKELATVLFSDSFGGQSMVSTDIQNWIGTLSISGTALAKNLELHVRAYEGNFLSIVEKTITSITDGGDVFTLHTEGGTIFQTKNLLVTTGAKRRTLSVPGAETLEHKGLTYCASCDGPFFKGKDVIVIGGGNAGFETATQLLAYTSSVTLLHRGSSFKADTTTVHTVLKNSSMKALTEVEVLEILGNTAVTGIRYIHNGKEHTLSVQGVFVEIGNIPASELVKDIVNLDCYGKIITDPRTQKTSHPHIWAAGDCTDGFYHQNNIAAGDSIKALEHMYLESVH